jgi:predicted dehydrogenase
VPGRSASCAISSSRSNPIARDGRPQTTAALWSWWFDAARGGGLLGAVGSHLIDLCRYWSGADVTAVAGGAATFGPPRADETGVPRRATSDDFASFVLRLSTGAVATITISAVAHHGPGHFAQVTGSEGTLVLTGETRLEIGQSGGALEDISPPDDLWEQLPVNNMWARSFVRLMRTWSASPRRGARDDQPRSVTAGRCRR